MPPPLFIGKVIYLRKLDKKPAGHEGYIAGYLVDETGFPAHEVHIFYTLDALITQFRLLGKTGLDLTFDEPQGIDTTERADTNYLRRYEALKIDEVHRVRFTLGKG